MVWWLCLSLVARATEEMPEEIVVYGDPYARWDDTRWLVAVEQVIPAGVRLGLGDAHSFRSIAWQAAAVLHCTRDPRDGGRTSHALCRVQDIALSASTEDLWQRKSDRQRVEEILDGIEARVQKQPLSVRTSKLGEVRAVQASDDMGAVGSTAQHIARQLMTAFHLDLPPGGVENGKIWSSFDDPLLQMPDTLVTRSSQLVVHRMDHYRGHDIIQTIGTASTRIVYDGARDQFAPSALDRLRSHFSVDGDPLFDINEKEIPCSTRIDGVAIYDRSLGAITERVWSVQGVGVDYWYAGHLVRIEGDAAIELPDGGQIAPPGRSRPGVARWRPIVAADLVGEGP